MKRVLSYALLFLIGSFSVRAQTYLARSNHKARLEPAGRILSGAGQDPAAFQAYWNTMKETGKPAVYMHYVSLAGVNKQWSKSLKTKLMGFGSFIIPQIGLGMTTDGSPEAHYEQEVAAGRLDADIEAFLDGLEALARPVYLRIGYEFNGLWWNGYQPSSYKQAFIRITQMIRERNLEVATVWCSSMDGAANFMDYYPGDEYVDWFGIDLFSVEHLTHPNTYNFLDLAVDRSKPVLIGESTPRYVGVLDGAASWYRWFVPYFNLIRSRPEIKMFCYINWDWSAYSQWSNWGDCRLEKNNYVKGEFSAEIDSTIYLHSTTEKEFRTTLGYDDSAAPAAPASLTVLSSDFPVVLQWSAVTDDSGLSHYIVYKNGVISGYSLKTTYEDIDGKAGERIEYNVTAMDRAGNESSASSSVTVVIPNPVNKTLNGEFDSGTDDWELFTDDGEATFEIDSNSIISGRNSAHVTINVSTGTDWHIQLRQALTIRRGMSYEIRYKARAGSGLTISHAVQQDHEPHSYPAFKNVTLGTEPRSFTDTFLAQSTDTAFLTFNLGNIGQSEVWIDEVSVFESQTNSLPYSTANRGAVSQLTSGDPGETVAGHALIEPNAGDSAPAGVAIFGFRQNGVLVTEAGVPASSLVREGRLFAELNGSVSTGLAIANPNDQPVSISYRFTDRSGNDFGAGNTTVRAKSQISAFLNQPPFNGGQSINGTFTFTSTLPVSVVALRGLNNERNEFLITTLPVSTLSAAVGTPIIFSHFADGGGWGTQVILVNPSDDLLNGSLQFFTQGSGNTGGQPLALIVNGQSGSSFSYFISPRSSVKFQTSASAPETTAGSVRVMPAANSKTPSGLAIFSFKQGGVTLSEAGVPALAAGSAFRLYVQAEGIRGERGSIQSGVAIANVSADAVPVTMELTNMDGSATGLTGAVTVPGSGQVAMFLNQVQGFAGLPAAFQGVLRIAAGAGTGISVVGLRGRFNERKDFLITTTPTVNEDDTASAQETAFPHFVDSGGYTTQFILLSGVKDQAASGKMRFFSQTGEPLLLHFR